LSARRKDLFEAARECLEARQPEQKVSLTRQVQQDWRRGALSLGSGADPAVQAVEPGRPERPVLVPPRALVKRSLGNPQGRAALLHAVAHIEFNAMNLAWDAIYRFRGMPPAYYRDWIRVAEEEAVHFRLLSAHLGSLDYRYGDFPAHNGLWEMAQETAYDVMARMALVPRVLEARGLDVTPAMIARLRSAGDLDAAAILERILADEVGHVAAGSRWFRYCCERRRLEPGATFWSLLRQHLRGTIKGPINREARRRAGFSDDELTLLETEWARCQGPQCDV
jgi:uncharacterized ferritin-like protein (DUF455 family)